MNTVVIKSMNQNEEKCLISVVSRERKQQSPVQVSSHTSLCLSSSWLLVFDLKFCRQMVNLPEWWISYKMKTHAHICRYKHTHTHNQPMLMLTSASAAEGLNITAPLSWELHRHIHTHTRTGKHRHMHTVRCQQRKSKLVIWVLKIYIKSVHSLFCHIVYKCVSLNQADLAVSSQIASCGLKSPSHTHIHKQQSSNNAFPDWKENVEKSLLALPFNDLKTSKKHLSEFQLHLHVFHVTVK